MEVNKDKVAQSLYSISFAGNGGEEELTIHVSGGQSGKSAVLAVAMQCDMGMKILKNDPAYPTIALRVLIQKILTTWGVQNDSDLAWALDRFAGRMANEHDKRRHKDLSFVSRSTSRSGTVLCRLRRELHCVTQQSYPELKVQRTG